MELNLEAEIVDKTSQVEQFENFGVEEVPNQQFPESIVGEVNDRTLLIKIHLQLYSISWEELEKIFSRFGAIEYTEILCPGGDFHSKIRFQNKESAITAFDSMNHREIYNGCCRMELSFDGQTSSRSSKIEAERIGDAFPSCWEETEVKSFKNQDFNMGISKIQESCLNLQDSYKTMKETNCNIIDTIEQLRESFREIADELRQWREEIEAKASTEESANSQIAENSEEQRLLQSSRIDIVPEPQGCQEDSEASVKDTKAPSQAKLQFQFEMPKVIHRPLNALVFVTELKRMDESVVVSIDTEMVEFWNAYNLFDEMPKRGIKVMGYSIWIFDPGGVRRQDCSIEVSSKPIEIRRSDLKKNSIRFLEIPSAHQLFVEMPSKGFELFTALVDGENALGRHMEFIAILWPYDRGKLKLVRSEDNEVPKKGVLLFTELVYRKVSFSSERILVGDIDVNCSKSVSFETIIENFGVGLKQGSITLPYDRGNELCNCFWTVIVDLNAMPVYRILVFDPGISKMVGFWRYFYQFEVRSDVGIRVAHDLIFVFDPGIAQGTNCYQIDPQVHLWSNGYKGCWQSTTRKRRASS